MKLRTFIIIVAALICDYCGSGSNEPQYGPEHDPNFVPSSISENLEPNPRMLEYWKKNRKRLSIAEQDMRRLSGTLGDYETRYKNIDRIFHYLSARDWEFLHLSYEDTTIYYEAFFFRTLEQRLSKRIRISVNGVNYGSSGLYICGNDDSYSVANGCRYDDSAHTLEFPYTKIEFCPGDRVTLWAKKPFKELVVYMGVQHSNHPYEKLVKLRLEKDKSVSGNKLQEGVAFSLVREAGDFFTKKLIWVFKRRAKCPAVRKG